MGTIQSSGKEGIRSFGLRKYTAREIKKIFATGAKKFVAQPDWSQIKKARRFLGGLVICAKKNVCFKFQRLMPTQGPSSKFGFCPRGLIHSVCYSIVVFCS